MVLCIGVGYRLKTKQVFLYIAGDGSESLSTSSLNGCYQIPVVCRYQCNMIVRCWTKSIDLY